MLSAIRFGVLVIREKDVDGIVGLGLEEKVENLSNTALLWWSNKVAHSVERRGDSAEIKSPPERVKASGSEDTRSPHGTK
jgi:hypothetical protein